MKQITVAILAKNEEQNIARCLRSVCFATEILLLDDHTSDNTMSLAKGICSDIKILPATKHSNFAQKRNLLQEKASNDWILYIDADEEVTPELKKEIEFMTLNENLVYAIKRVDIFWNKKILYGELWPIRKKGIIRLIHKKSGKWVGAVHEIFETKNKVNSLQKILLHYPHQTIAEFLSEINTYSTIRAKELLDNNISEPNYKAYFYPLFKFVQNYFFRLGFLDGAAGFIYAFMMSFHSFLVRAKLYQYKHLQ